MAEALALWRLRGVGLHANLEAPLEVDEGIEVQKNVVDGVLGEDVVLDELSLVVLKG